MIAGGKSKYICIYSVKEEVLVKRFEISQNKSFDGIDVSLLNKITCLFIIFKQMWHYAGIFGSSENDRIRKLRSCRDESRG